MVTATLLLTVGCLAPQPGRASHRGGGSSRGSSFCALEWQDTCVKTAGRDDKSICDTWTENYPATATDFSNPTGETCSVGTTDSTAVDDMLRRTNLYRWLAGVADVTFDDDLNAAATACAVIQAHSGGNITHYPSTTAACYSEEGANAAAKSNIYYRYGPGGAPTDCVSSFIEDFGANNLGALGHRMWMLYPTQQTLGFGFSEVGALSACCIYVNGPQFSHQTAGGPSSWVIYPPPGVVPYQVVADAMARGEMRLRWTFTAPDASFLETQVTMTESQESGDEVFPVDDGVLDQVLDPGIWIEPQRDVKPDTLYTVSLEVPSLGQITYRVYFSSCGDP